MRSRAVLLTLSAIMMGAILGGVASAQILMVSSRTGLGATDLVGWNQLGGTGTIVNDPSNFASTGGLTGSISDSSNSVLAINQQGSGWSGNFTQGDYLLWDETGTGSLLNISFDTPISAAGANIQADSFGTFNATISAYDSSNNMLGTFTEPGNSNSLSDGSAIFLGISSSTADISKITYGISNSAGTDFAINQLGIRANPSTNVPEPGDLALLLSGGLSGLALILKRSFVRTA